MDTKVLQYSEFLPTTVTDTPFDKCNTGKTQPLSDEPNTNIVGSSLFIQLFW